MQLSNGTTLSAAVFIDATYEGDLLSVAGVDFTVGRESQAQYGESLAGRRPLVPSSCYGFHKPISPFVSVDAVGAGGVYLEHKPQPASSVLPMIWDGPMVGSGEADTRVMSYNYRLCLTNATTVSGGQRREIKKPSTYDPAFFELARRYMKAEPPRSLTPSVLKIYEIISVGDGVKADVNSAIFPVSTNLVGGSWGYPNGTEPERAVIIERHQSYTKNLLWFLRSDPSVPPQLRAEMSTWAWCADEWIDNQNFPTQLCTST